MLPILMKDGYKSDHRRQYPSNTQMIFSNLTARGSRIPDIDSTIFFGLQYYLKEYLVKQWSENFFQRPLEEVIDEYTRIFNAYCPLVTYEHIENLHNLGYLPIEVRAVPEGTKVPIRVPMLSIHNTNPNFFWLTNVLETSLSNIIWAPITVATIAYKYRQTFERFFRITGGIKELIPYLGHDFSYRGVMGLEGACLVGSAHLTSFIGSDTIPAIPFVEKYYGAHGNIIAQTVPATEHSVMCAGGDFDERETFRRLITETYPSGIVSIVSDTWDFWNVITNIIPSLKDQILARDGKLTVRPDSGNPVNIICGDPNAEPDSPEHKGAIQCLYDTFGGTYTSKGYIVLDSHIGLVYGDAITRERQLEILNRLESKGFASTNVVLGIGSYSYQYNTRDTFGMAIKATAARINGIFRPIFKDPKTDSGLKKSIKGFFYVDRDFRVHEDVPYSDIYKGIFRTVFKDGVIQHECDFNEVRSRINENF